MAAQIPRSDDRGNLHALREAVNASDKAGQTLRGAKSLLPMPTTMTDSASSPAAPVNAALNSSRSSPVLVRQNHQEEIPVLYLHTDRNTSCNLGPMVKQSHGAGQINSSAGLSARHVDNQHCQLNACTDVTFVVSLLASVHETGANGDITYLVLSVTNCHLYDAWS